MAHISELITYEEVFHRQHSILWQKAIDLELQSLTQNKTWTIVELPPNGRTDTCKWIFKTIYQSNGEINKYKAHMVARGYTHVPQINNFDTYSHILKLYLRRV